MRYAIAILLFVHGVIHLMGVAKEWRLSFYGFNDAASLRLPTPAASLTGAFWLVACLALLSAAVMLLLREPRWWMMTAGAVLLSQALILTSWSDARAGTIANVLLALAVAVAWANARFSAEGDALVRDLLARTAAEPASIVEASELQALPAPVASWLEHAGIVGRPRARNARLRQSGGMRLAADQAFMPARADQYFSVSQPGFVWRAIVSMFHVPVVGRDTYLHGRGRMTIKALALVPVVDAQGPELNQGTLLRFLGELVWFPSAALEPYVRWEPLDARSARAHVSYEDTSVSADFFFDEESRLERTTAQRYMKSGSAPAVLRPWVVRMTRWQKLDGVLIPTEGEVSWLLDAGELTYYRFRIDELQENVREPYEAAP